MSSAVLSALRRATTPSLAALAAGGVVLASSYTTPSECLFGAKSSASNVHVLRETNLTKSLFTIIRDKNTSRGEFVITSNRLSRLIIEEALSLLPATPVTTETPVGKFEGIKLPAEESICIVSIVRGADSMAEVARAMMPAISVGKILIQRDDGDGVKYAKLPDNIAKGPVLLLDPMCATGGSVCDSIRCLVSKGVPQESIVFVNMFAVKEGLERIAKAYPAVKVVTGCIDPILNDKNYIVPGCGDFGDRYFGTD